mmetsp:Transcript_9750/g.15984  ORF Transcript_9750/g.15984 Transcript_9750/m.15984 type:complete len:379 (-) Transcript_9750:414-1550(-)|eukprot:CAMPEP_0203775782 /NCGR_PEP_ID=MMETSP0099_2-20121227/6329_1 /ASSEMBLY_ACC=CAM_ASM_000209 /TAXON_ID=96639 /ORGANISM=" , Strain NY0313808BC1" /LENGTH=378 /DNA_ID=CAMNT_0050674611 /DNA_START=391 /DNA_END=1527 /DNA_ORIENTATION=-
MASKRADVGSVATSPRSSKVGIMKFGVLLDRRRRTRKRKKVAMGIDLGYDYVRACTWSLSKQRVDVLNLGGQREPAISGVGCKYLLSGDPEFRAEFIAKVFEVFEIVQHAVAYHYSKSIEWLDFAWTVITTSNDQLFVKEAIEEAAGKVVGLHPPRFMTGPLASCLGEWAYQQLRLKLNKIRSIRNNCGYTLAICVDTHSTRIGLVRIKENTNMYNITTTTLPELNATTLKAAGEKGNEPENSNLLGEFQEAIKKVLSTAVRGRDRWVPDRVLVIDGGVNLANPAFCYAILKAVGDKNVDLFYPKWTPNFYLCAMGAAAQSGFLIKQKVGFMTEDVQTLEADNSTAIRRRILFGNVEPVSSLAEIQRAMGSLTSLDPG